MSQGHPRPDTLRSEGTEAIYEPVEFWQEDSSAYTYDDELDGWSSSEFEPIEASTRISQKV